MNNIHKRNHVTILGDGEEIVVFGHGFGCSQDIWTHMIPYFKDTYQLVLFDYVGSGKSDLNAYDIARYKNLEGYALDVIDVLEALDIGPVLFVAHSVSAMIALLAANKRPDLFKSIVMIAPSPRYMNDLPNYKGGFDSEDISELLNMMERNFAGWASASVASLIQTPDNPELVHELESSFHSEDPIIMKNFAQATFMSDHRLDLDSFKTPCLIIQCSEDSIVPIEVGYYLHDHIQDSQLHIMNSRGHYPQLSKPEETSRLVLDFLKLGVAL